MRRVIFHSLKKTSGRNGRLEPIPVSHVKQIAGAVAIASLLMVGIGLGSGVEKVHLSIMGFRRLMWSSGRSALNFDRITHWKVSTMSLIIQYPQDEAGRAFKRSERAQGGRGGATAGGRWGG